jgi:hypothetical protein
MNSENEYKEKSPAPIARNRARFSYDDLLGLFSYYRALPVAVAATLMNVSELRFS